MSRRPLLPLLALAALLVLTPACRALKCFQCSEPTQGLQAGSVPKGGFVWSSEPICSKFDSTNSTFKKDCPQTFDKSCFKTISAGAVVSRGCYNVVQNNCTNEVGGESTCYCTTDYCNSAGLTTPALLLLLPAALLAALHSRQ